MSGEPTPPQQELTVGEAVRQALDHEQAGRLVEAEGLAAAILGAVPDHADALALLGALRLRRGERSAPAVIAAAIRHAGPDAPFFANLGSLLRRAGALGRARAAQERALALDPGFAVVWFNLANARREGGEQDGAIAAYRRAARLLPSHPEPRRRLAELLLEAGEPAGAVAAAADAVGLDPLSAEARGTLGNALRALGKLEQAAACQRVALVLRPDFVPGFANLGAVLIEAEAPGGAPALRRAVRLRPEDGALWLSLGEALARAEDTGAVEALRRALALDPCGVRGVEKLAGVLFEFEGTGQESLLLPPAHAQTQFALTRQADRSSAESGEKVGMRGFGAAERVHEARPAHPDPSPGGETGLGAGRWHRRAVRLKGREAGRIVSLNITPAKHWSAAAGQPYRTIFPSRSIAEAFVVRVDEALVHPGNFAVETPGGALLLDGLHAYSRTSLELLPHIVRHSADDRVLADLSTDPIRIDDEAVLLGGDANFSHGLLDWASRLCVLDRCPDLSRLPVLVSDAVRPGMIELYGLLGLDSARLVRVPAGRPLSCRRLWLPSLTHAFQDMAPEHLAFLRQRTVEAQGLAGVPRTRRLYLTRRTAAYRTLVNEEEVTALLADEGFECFVPDRLPIREQIAAFAAAERVVAPAGGGTGALVFAPPGTRVLELTHAHMVLPQYARLCGLLGQPYRQIVGAPVRNRGSLAFDWDFRIEPGEVAKALAELAKP